MVSTVDSAKTSLSYLTAHAATLQARSSSPNQNLLPLSAQVSDTDHLVVGGCDVPELVERFGSPLYILDEATLRAACQQYREAMARHYPGEALVIYASKAWNCLAVCAVVHSEGLGVDVVSAGELLTAIQAGVPAEHLYFHGNNKSLDELQQGIESGCRIVVDNWFELESLSQLLTGAESAVP
ncbi:MAG: diaminopimelate decarboxylase, partial [Cyanobacteria bacterium P01_A01_bin.70]